VSSAIDLAVPTTGEIIPFSRDSIASATATRTSLQLPEDLSLSDWAQLGDALGQAEQSVMWWVGDWWVRGAKWDNGDGRKTILDELRKNGHNPPPFKTCVDAGYVARRFLSSDRSELLSWTHHNFLARISDEKDRRWFFDRAIANKWSVAQLREEIRQYKLCLLKRPGEGQYETQTVDDLELLVKRGRQFGTIYADPPWPYSNQATRASTKNHYKEHNELSVEDICNLPIAELAAENAHCHLWTTNGFLREAFDVLEAWGFTYKSFFEWVKPDFGIGNYWRVGTEHMLLGIRGRAPFQDNSQQNWIYERAREHSVKPAKVRRLIELCSPGPRLELFGRREVENWTVWGNEIEREKAALTLFPVS